MDLVAMTADEEHERHERFRPREDASTSRLAELKALYARKREKYIADGVIPDPSRPGSLEDAKKLVGVCADMCPEYERLEREVQKELDRWEVFAGTTRANPAAAVKIYRRPAAGRELPLPEEVRPPPVLKATLDYLFHTLLPADPSSEQFAAVQPFLWNRTRAIRQDFIVQSDREALAIECHERIARYHILCLHWKGGVGAEAWSEQQELEQLRKSACTRLPRMLTAALRSLIEFYDDQRLLGHACPNEAEFRAYNLLMHARDPEALREVELLPPALFSAPSVERAFRLRTLVQRSNMLVKRGNPRNTVSTPNFFTRFFTELRRADVSYLEACLAENLFPSARIGAVKSLARAYMTQHNGLPLSFLIQALGTDGVDDTVEFLQLLGVEVAAVPNGGDELVARINKATVLDAQRLREVRARLHMFHATTEHAPTGRNEPHLHGHAAPAGVQGTVEYASGNVDRLRRLASSAQLRHSTSHASGSDGQVRRLTSDAELRTSYARAKGMRDRLWRGGTFARTLKMHLDALYDGTTPPDKWTAALVAQRGRAKKASMAERWLRHKLGIPAHGEKHWPLLGEATLLVTDAAPQMLGRGVDLVIFECSLPDGSPSEDDQTRFSALQAAITALPRTLPWLLVIAWDARTLQTMCASVNPTCWRGSEPLLLDAAQEDADDAFRAAAVQLVCVPTWPDIAPAVSLRTLVDPLWAAWVEAADTLDRLIANLPADAAEVAGDAFVTLTSLGNALLRTVAHPEGASILHLPDVPVGSGGVRSVLVDMALEQLRQWQLSEGSERVALLRANVVQAASLPHPLPLSQYMQALVDIALDYVDGRSEPPDACSVADFRALCARAVAVVAGRGDNGAVPGLSADRAVPGDVSPCHKSPGKRAPVHGDTGVPVSPVVPALDRLRTMMASASLLLHSPTPSTGA
ncbi:actin cytoskeleton and mitosis protein [Malassezia sp. CBS 17886]|nr:actin cytoskeleton and mitosis protein [Malassezia sp. CBS 17886]